MRDSLMEKLNEIEESLFQEIKNYFLLDKTSERCGLITKKNNSFLFIPSENISKNKVENFSISPRDYLKAADHGKVIGCVHSHLKDRSFSLSDINNSFKHNMIYILYNIKKDKFYFFDPEQYKKYKKYINLDFELGKNDCANIIYNFYKNELNFSKDINMPDLNIFGNYENLKNKNLHIWDKEIYKKNCNYFRIFKPSSFDELMPFDIIVFNDISKKPVHAAIYLGEELILHQTVGYPSRIEGLRKFHLRFISYVARLKNDSI